MVQTKTFGDLTFNDEEHGWALEVGLFLGSWLLCHSQQCPDEVENNFRTHEAMCKSNVMRRLQMRRINIEIPDRDAGPEASQVSVEDAILRAVRTECSSAHCAFVLIGMAASFFEWVDCLKHLPGAALQMQLRSRTAIRQLQQRCAALFPNGVQQEAIFEQLRRTNGDPHRVRKLMSDINKPMVILLVLADPRDGGRLRLSTEQQRLDDSLRQSLHRDSFNIQVLAEVTAENFGPSLARTKPTIVHFSGHGSEDGLFFSTASGEAKRVEPKLLSRVLSKAGREDNLQGIVLNACFTAETFRNHHHIGQQVVLMEGSLDDSAAIGFTQQFYAYLGEGRSFKEAFEWAEMSVDLTGSVSINASFIG